MICFETKGGDFMTWTTNWAEVEAPANDLMGREETAKWLGVTPASFDAYVRNGSMPDGVRLFGTTKLWSKRRLLAFIEDKFVEQQLAGAGAKENPGSH
jgi:hypothetical protein